MIDPCHIWNVICNARSNRHRPPTSPNTAPATKSYPHHWSLSRMKRHLHCAEQQASPSNLTKYCACHKKCFSWLILVKWNVIYNARSNRHHPSTSPNAAPATNNDSHDWALSHMKRHLQCAEQQVSLSNLTKYCACHERLPPWLILVTYETLFAMRGATGIALQPHQILRLPRKVTLIIDPCHVWNVIYIARSNRHHPPTSPNTVPATKNASHDWSLLNETLFTMRGATGITLQPHQMLRLPRTMILMIEPCHIWNVIYNARSNRCHCPTSPNTAPATKNDRPKCERNLLKTDETSFTMRDRSETVPSMIRPWNRQSATRLATEVTVRAHHEHFLLKNITFSAPAISFQISRNCACHEKWHFNFTKYCACHEKWHLDFTKYLPRKVTLGLHQILRLPRNVTLGLHQILRLPRKVTLLLADSSITVLYYYLTLLLLNSCSTWLY